MLFAAFHDPKETISTMRTAAMQYEEFTANVIQNFSKSYIPYINGGNAQRQGKMNVIYLPLRDVLGRSQCHPAAAEGAKLSKIRRGKRFSFADTACRISSDSRPVFVVIYMS